ncbi:hypothetical protein [Pseudomonas putida]
MSSELTFQDLLEMKLRQQGRKLEILRSLSEEDANRLRKEGVAHLKRLQSRMGKHTQLPLRDVQ